MTDSTVMLITGTSRGIGRSLVEYYTEAGCQVIGCSRTLINEDLQNYYHYCLDIGDEPTVKKMFSDIRKRYGRLDVLINNAGIASMNHSMITPIHTVRSVLETNVIGTFLFCREAARLMQPRRCGRIINFTTVAIPLKLEGEAVYAASKAAVITLTHIMAKEFGSFGITVNAIGPSPIKTDLIRGVSKEKLELLIQSQAIKRYGEYKDVINVIDFFISPKSDFITGQVLFLGGA